MVVLARIDYLNIKKEENGRSKNSAQPDGNKRLISEAIVPAGCTRHVTPRVSRAGRRKA